MSIKCLMVGQAGIGKRTFLSKFPNAKKLPIPETTSKLAISDWKETYLIEYMNSKFETVRIELDICDISLETCLRSSGVPQSATVDGDFMSATIRREDTFGSLNKQALIPMMPMNSSKFIDITAYKIIIMCFALDDANSFELIKSKWNVDLKKNRSQTHSFILIGLKGDVVFSNEKTLHLEQPNHLMNDSHKTQIPKKDKKKKRSSSVNSSSSTSRLKRRERVISAENDSSSNKILFTNGKKFAKQIGSSRILVVSNFNSKKNVSSVAAEDLSIYDKFLKSVTKMNEVVDRQRRRDEDKLQKKAKLSKIPKSISAPMNFIKLKAKSSTANRVRINEDQNSIDDFSIRKNEHANESFLDKHTIEDTKSIETNTNQQKTVEKVCEPVKNNLSIRNKLSRFAIGLGTYLVTCGSSTRTRKLADLKKLKNQATFEETSLSTKNANSVPKSKVKKNKSWLLLASELSLNSTENDDVFS